MTPDELTAHWRLIYGGEPRAHELRARCRERWVRIYSLPDGKRYPETEEDYTMILARHNAVLSTLLDAETEVVLVTTGYTFTDTQAPVQEAKIAHADAWHWWSIPCDADDRESTWWHLYARHISWKHGSLDAIWRLVADDKCWNLMVLGVRRCVLYHPYDGGGDLILRNGAECEVMRKQFADWISPLASGL